MDTAGGKRQLKGVDPEPQTLKSAQDLSTCVSSIPCAMRSREEKFSLVVVKTNDTGIHSPHYPHTTLGPWVFKAGT